MTSDQSLSDEGSIPFDAEAPPPPLARHLPAPNFWEYVNPPAPRNLQLRSRLVTYSNPNYQSTQPTPTSLLDRLTDPVNPIVPAGPSPISISIPTLNSGPPTRTRSPTPLEYDPIYNEPFVYDTPLDRTFSNPTNSLTGSSTPSSTRSLLYRETDFLGLSAASDRLSTLAQRHIDAGAPAVFFANLPRSSFYMLTENELLGLDAEIYGGFDPAVHGLTFSREHLRRLFIEAEIRWRPLPFSEGEREGFDADSRSSGLDWEDRRREEDWQRTLEAMEEWRTSRLGSPLFYPGELGRDPRENLEERAREEEQVTNAEPERPSRRRNISEVDAGSEEDEATARGRPQPRLDPVQVGVEEVRDPEPAHTFRRRNISEVDADADDEAVLRGRPRPRLDPVPDFRRRGRRRAPGFAGEDSLFETDERLRLARERAAAQQAAATRAQADETLAQAIATHRTLYVEGFFRQHRTAEEIRARIPGYGEYELRRWEVFWQRMLLWCRQHRVGRVLTEEELRGEGVAEDVIAEYLDEPFNENARLPFVRYLSGRGLVEAGIIGSEVDLRSWRFQGMSNEQILAAVSAIIQAKREQQKLEGSQRLTRQIEEEHLDGPARIAQDRQVVDEEGYFSRWWTTGQLLNLGFSLDAIVEHRARWEARLYYEFEFAFVPVGLGLTGRALQLWWSHQVRKAARAGVGEEQLRNENWPEEQIEAVLAFQAVLDSRARARQLAMRNS